MATHSQTVNVVINTADSCVSIHVPVRLCLKRSVSDFHWGSLCFWHSTGTVTGWGALVTSRLAVPHRFGVVADSASSCWKPWEWPSASSSNAGINLSLNMVKSGMFPDVRSKLQAKDRETWNCMIPVARPPHRLFPWLGTLFLVLSCPPNVSSWAAQHLPCILKKVFPRSEHELRPFSAVLAAFPPAVYLSRLRFNNYLWNWFVLCLLPTI